MFALAEQLVRRHISVTGVQPKLSLTLAATGQAGQPTRFSIVGALGAYIHRATNWSRTRPCPAAILAS
jgi:serine/threonine-protein kinase HipA